MKKLLIVSVITAAVALSTFAQSIGSGAGSATPRYGSSPVTVAASLPVAASSASNINAIVDCRFQKTVTLQASLASDATASAASVFWQRSVDKVSWETGQWAGLGTPTISTNTAITNLDTLGCGYIKLSYLTNSHASANITNATLVYGVKLLAP